MNGNISKTRGVLGSTGPRGPQGIQGLRGLKGDKGDTPSIVFKYDSETGNLYYKSDGILVDKEYLDSNNIVTKEQLDGILEGASSVRTVTISLLESEWEPYGNNYSQVVIIEGTTPNSKVDLQPSVEQLNVFYEKDITFVTENKNGTITVVCIGQKPTSNYTMQATITEVSDNG